MTLSAIIPVALLSLFPHQEPRFLIPILLPLVYLHGMTILPEQDHTLVEAPKNHTPEARTSKQISYVIFKFWLFINTLLIIFYGFLHQGGVFPATAYLHQDLKVTPATVNFHVVLTYMYSMPESFLMQLPSDKVITKATKRYKVDRRVHLFEEGSKNMTSISEKLDYILKVVESQHPQKNKVYFLTAGSFAEEFEIVAKKYEIKFVLQETFFPHISLEAFPDLSRYCIDFLKVLYNNDCEVVEFHKYLRYLFNMFKLNLYKITRHDVNFVRNVNENEFI